MYLVLFHEFSLPCSHACLFLLFVLHQFTFDLSKVNVSMGAESLGGKKLGLRCWV
jgi:hypothetical protein